jgi:cytoskeletal protein RodZ
MSPRHFWTRGWFWALVGLAGFVGINVLAANAQSNQAAPPAPISTVAVSSEEARPETVTVAPTPTAGSLTPTAEVSASATEAPASPTDAANTEATNPAVYYPNCAAVWAAIGRPIERGEPGYGDHLDGDKDGRGCVDEPG